MALRNGYPRPELMGINDKSGRTLQPEPLLIPTHLPYFMTYTQRGRLRPTLISGDRGVRLYGAKTFDLTSKYATHQTLFMNQARGNGNAVFLKRLKPLDAAPASTLLIWADVLVIPEQPIYQRNSDGSILRDANGVPQPLMAGGNPVTATGYDIQWLATKSLQVNANGDNITQTMIDNASGPNDPTIIPVANALGQANPVQGSRTNSAMQLSMRYPMFEFEADNFGEWGNNIGVRLQALSSKTSPQADEDSALANRGFPFFLQLTERDVITALDRVINPWRGGDGLEFMLKEDAYDSNAKLDLWFEHRFKSMWTDETDLIDPTYSPIGKHHVYYNNYRDVAQMVATSENTYDSDFSDLEEDVWLVNLLTAKDLSGNEYHTLTVGGLNFTRNTTHLLRGGSDGTMSNQAFDDLVRYEYANFGQTGYPLQHSGLFPISSFWDSGFSIETKEAMLTPLAIRKDVVVHLCDQDLGESLNTPVEQSSIAAALYQAARAYPDSEVYGTPVCRVTIMKGSARLISSTWRGVNGLREVPYNLEFLDKVSKYMGAGDGIWRGEANFTRSPNNRITLFLNDKPDDLVLSETVKSVDWANGAISVEPYDMRDAFVPAWQTAYDDDTSVLNSVPTVYGCVEVWKVMERTWRDMSGEDKYTNDQFVKRSNQLLEERTTGRFDDRFVIVPDTVFTPIDENNGFSWTAIVRIYANNMRTYGKMTIESWRMSDLNINA